MPDRTPPGRKPEPRKVDFDLDNAEIRRLRTALREAAVRARVDPARLRFDLTDEDGALVASLPLAELRNEPDRES